MRNWGYWNPLRTSHATKPRIIEPKNCTRCPRMSKAGCQYFLTHWFTGPVRGRNYNMWWFALIPTMFPWWVCILPYFTILHDSIVNTGKSNWFRSLHMNSSQDLLLRIFWTTWQLLNLEELFKETYTTTEIHPLTISIRHRSTYNKQKRMNLSGFLGQKSYKHRMFRMYNKRKEDRIKLRPESSSSFFVRQCFLS